MGVAAGRGGVGERGNEYDTNKLEVVRQVKNRVMFWFRLLDRRDRKVFLSDYSFPITLAMSFVNVQPQPIIIRKTVWLDMEAVVHNFYSVVLAHPTPSLSTVYTLP